MRLQYQVNPTTMGTRDQDVVLVEDGKAIEPNLERERITLEELAAQARLSEIDSISDVRWAVLETSGAISFIPRSK